MTTAARRGILLGVLSLYLVGLAFVGVWPTPVVEAEPLWPAASFS